MTDSASMRANSSGPLPTAITNRIGNNISVALVVGSHKEDRSDERIHRFIQDAYEGAGKSAPLQVPIAKLGMKLALPQYSGADTLEEFDRFLAGLIRYLRKQLVVGRDRWILSGE
jgi:hypothetical protein